MFFVVLFKKHVYLSNFVGDISNMSVEQYMLWVHNQANRLPSVTRVDRIECASENVTPNKSNNAQNDFRDIYASDAWKSEMILEFVRLREVCLYSRRILL